VVTEAAEMVEVFLLMLACRSFGMQGEGVVCMRGKSYVY
jgi:hypothetical protein